jgi:long-chain fatty acid transport protein
MSEKRQPNTQILRAGLALALVAGSFAGLGILGGAGLLLAQTNDEIGAGLEFDFSPPGARSLGLGGAFLALADDATAAYANPAGLLQLHRPEVALEVRAAAFETTFVDGGSFNGTPTGTAATFADGSNIDAFAELVENSSTSRTAGLSFFSVSYPRRDWAVALFRHELTRFAATIDRSAGFFFSTAGASGQEVRRRAAPISAELDLTIEDLGLSGAYRLADRFWIGASVQAFRFRFDARTHRYRGQTAEGVTRFDDDPGIYAAENEFDRHLQTGDSTAWSGAASFLWSSADRRHRIGGIYRPGPSFPFDYRFLFGAAAVAEGIAADPAEQLEALRRTGTGRFRVPDSWGLGWVFEPRSNWLISTEWKRVQSSELTPRANILKDIRFAGGEPLGCCAAAGDLPDEGYNAGKDSMQLFEVENGYELHAGVEWARPRASGGVLALRAGIWGESEHQVRYLGENPRLAGRFVTGEDSIHGAVGFGWTHPFAAGTGRLHPSSMSIDFGFDASRRRQLASGSVVVRF